MTTAIRAVRIEKLVEGLRRLSQTVFDEIEPLRRFLEEMPVTAESLAPYPTWDRQHYTRNLIDRTPVYELMAIC